MVVKDHTSVQISISILGPFFSIQNGRVRFAELHWYEAHGIGKKEIKRKRYLE